MSGRVLVDVYVHVRRRYLNNAIVRQFDRLTERDERRKELTGNADVEADLPPEVGSTCRNARVRVNILSSTHDTASYGMSLLDDRACIEQPTRLTQSGGTRHQLDPA